MAVGYQAPEDIVNAALRAIGYSRPVGEIYEGSRASRVAVEVYGPARDGLLQSHDWDFALREATLVAVMGGTKILGFTQEYAYPATALRICAVHAAIPAPNFDPRPARFKTGNDSSLSTPAKVIFANITPAFAVYIAQITDPLTWNAAFTQAFVNVLACIFAFALRDDINLARTRTAIAEQTTLEAVNIGDAMGPMIPELMARGAAAANRQQ
jgi:hypothetical protein